MLQDDTEEVAEFFALGGSQDKVSIPFQDAFIFQFAQAGLNDLGEVFLAAEKKFMFEKAGELSDSIAEGL